MSTVAELDTEVALAIAVNTSLANRMNSDYDIDTGEVVPDGTRVFRQRVDVQNKVDMGSNIFSYGIQIEIDSIVKMATPVDERDDLVTIWTDQQVFTDPEFWRTMAAVFELAEGTTPQIVEPVTRVGQVLLYTATVQLVLQP